MKLLYSLIFSFVFFTSFFAQEIKSSKKVSQYTQEQEKRIYDFSICSNKNYNKCFKKTDTPDVFDFSKATDEKSAKKVYKKQLSKYVFNNLDESIFNTIDKKLNKKYNTFTINLMYWTNNKGEIIQELVGSNLRGFDKNTHDKIAFLLSKAKLNKQSTSFSSLFINKQNSISFKLKKDNETNSYAIIKRKKKKKKKFNINDSITSPIYKGCHLLEDIYSEETYKAERKCMEHYISKYILKEIDLNVIKTASSSFTKYGIYDKKIKSYAIFKFNKTGEISNIKALSMIYELEREIISILKSIPNVKPGTRKGKPVNVKYHIPISFKTSTN